MEGVLHHVITTIISNCVQKELQLLLYIRGESWIDKSRISKKIELRFSLLFCRADLVLAAPTRATASNIKGCMIYTCLEIGVRHNQGRSNKVSSMWTQPCTFIIDEVCMVELDMLSNMAKQLAKARGFSIKSTIIFGRLLIVIFMEDFYQFPPMIGQPLWEEVCVEEDSYDKILWKSFNAVITLTQQIR